MITPIINDPYVFGQIAASNSLSDIFAMGGKVLYALNVCSFPKELDSKDSQLILEGALSKVIEANALITGGHTINEPSLLFGLSVTGIIEDGKYFSNNMAKPNQSIILTKPYGIGIYNVANNNEQLNDKQYKQWIDTMITLNDKTSLIAKKYISTMTDVTGFGLIGHAYEVAKASNLSITIDYDKVLMFDKVEDYAKAGYLTGSSYSNLNYLKDFITSTYEELYNLILCDPQTSGGLLLFVDKDKEEYLLHELNDEGIVATTIGYTKDKDEYYIHVE